MPHCLCWRLIVVVVVGVLSLLSASRIWHLVVEVVVGVLSSSLFRRCWQRRFLLCLRPLASAPCCRCRHRWSLIVGGFSLLLSSLDSCRWLYHSWVSYRRRLVVVVAVVVNGGVLSLSAASRRSLKRLVYIRLTMNATTMDPQNQA